MSAKFHVPPSVAPVVLLTTRSTYRDLGLPEDLSACCASAATLSPTLPPLVIVPQAAFESVRARSRTTVLHRTVAPHAAARDPAFMSASPLEKEVAVTDVLEVSSALCVCWNLSPRA